MELGYALSSEEHSPAELVRNAQLAEEAGFSFGLISDHIHPWIDAQGHSAFVWSVLGGIAQATSEFRIGTGVTCPLIRIHPAIVAHAAATTACLMPGRFFLGVGTGENLNEHVLGAKWPAPDQRLEMLEEAVEVMRLLRQGDHQTHRGKHYTVENLRIFDLPDEPVEVAVAAMQPNAAELAGKIGDALVEGSASQELPLPKDFEQLVEDREADDLEETLTLGPDVDEYVEELREYEQAGYTHVYVHQVGPDQEGFLKFAKSELFRRACAP